MKRSTLLFVSANLVLLLIPAFLMLGLRMKIATGDVTDLKAKREAEYKVDNNVGAIECIILKSRYHGINLRLEMDTIDRITMDTTTAKYVRYKLDKGILTIEYDFEKDSLENSPLFEVDEETGKREKYIYSPKWITVNTTSSLKKYDIRDGMLEIILSENNLIRNDLEIVGLDSRIDFIEEEVDFIDLSTLEERVKMDSLTYKVKLTLDRSDLDMDLDYVKELEVKLKETEITNFVNRFERMDLQVDRYSPLLIDVAEWDKIKLKYKE